MEFVLQNSIFMGQQDSGMSLELIVTTGKIFNITFVSNRRGKYRERVKFGDNLYIGPAFVGGPIVGVHSIIDISQSMFDSNKAIDYAYGGALFAERGSFINVRNSTFSNNHASYRGVLYSFCSNIVIEATRFISNTGSYGGALWSYGSNISIETSEFHNNIATQEGGVLLPSSINIIISDSHFTNNNSSIGAVIYATEGSKLEYDDTIIVANNSVERYALIYLTDSEVKLRNIVK